MRDELINSVDEYFYQDIKGIYRNFSRCTMYQSKHDEYFEYDKNKLLKIIQLLDDNFIYQNCIIGIKIEGIIKEDQEKLLRMIIFRLQGKIVLLKDILHIHSSNYDATIIYVKIKKSKIKDFLEKILFKNVVHFIIYDDINPTIFSSIDKYIAAQSALFKVSLYGKISRASFSFDFCDKNSEMAIKLIEEAKKILTSEKK